MSSTIHTELTGKETLSDFEKLLDLAEKLQDKCETAETWITFMRIFQLLILALTSAAMLYSLLLESGKVASTKEVIAFSFILVIVLGCGYWANRTIEKIDYRLRQDRSSLKEVVGLLREVESVESKSALERAYFRIRLSRFNIGY